VSIFFRVAMYPVTSPYGHPAGDPSAGRLIPINTQQCCAPAPAPACAPAYPVQQQCFVDRCVQVPVERVVKREVDVPHTVYYDQHVGPTVITKEVSYPVQKIIERRVEVPYEVICPDRLEVPVPFEKIVERSVPRPYEVIKRVEVPYPVEEIVEKEVPYPVEQIVEKIVTVEVPNPVVEQVPVPEPYEVIEYRDVPTPIERIIKRHIPVAREEIIERVRHVQVPSYGRFPVQGGFPGPQRVEVPFPVDRVVPRAQPFPVQRVVPRSGEVPVRIPQYVQVPVERIRHVDVPVPVEQVVEKIVEKIINVPVPIPREHHVTQQVTHQRRVPGPPPHGQTSYASAIPATEFSGYPDAPALQTMEMPTNTYSAVQGGFNPGANMSQFGTSAPFLQGAGYPQPTSYAVPPTQVYGGGFAPQYQQPVFFQN